MMFGAQLLALAQAVLLTALTFSGHVEPWHLLVLAPLLGVSSALEVPARHSLLADIAGADLSNAVALNSTLVNSTRLVGPALGGLVVAWAGEGWCFAVNAVSYLAVLLALHRMDIPRRAKAATDGSVAEAVRFAWNQPMIRLLFSMLLVVSFVAFPFQSLMPLVVGEVLQGGPALLGQLGAAFGAGSLLAAIVLLRRTSLEGLARWIAYGASGLSLGLIALGVSTHPWVSAVALVVTGFGFLLQGAGVLTLLNNLVPDSVRGRILGLFTTIFFGATPFGALVSGWMASRYGVSVTLVASGSIVLVASGAFHFVLSNVEREGVSSAESTESSQPASVSQAG